MGELIELFPEDDYFGVCPTCRHVTGYRNIGRDHWFYCDTHRVAWWAGSNLFSDWREETEADWQFSRDYLAGFRVIR